LRCRLLKFMEPPWFAPVVAHYGKSRLRAVRQFRVLSRFVLRATCS
jgi:hypothetical protein